MIGFKVNSFNDSSTGEPEQDANSALTEIDKGLRSGKVGEQCEAIVRFPRLFEKYPFPILINSSFLKLSDVFRLGNNNFLRLWVLRVCQQSEKHLDKILNVDEFLRRVFSVLHSNDPVARALTLKTLGAVAGIIPERQNVHHAIRRGLDSHDDVEVDAAIYATTRFAAHSNTFAVAMCNKLSDMVECENTGAERRDKLIRALRTVHGGAIRAQGVLELLRSLMQRFPASSSVRAAISALTAIADDTVVHVPDQVEFLLSLVQGEARRSVRVTALAGLARLARHAALWPPQAVLALHAAAAAALPRDHKHALLYLQVMQILVKCPAVCAAATPLRQFCLEAALSPQLRVAAAAVLLYTDIVVHCYEESLPVDGAELMMSLESLVVTTAQDDGKDNIYALRVALKCLVRLCKVQHEVYALRTAALLGRQVRTAREGRRVRCLLEALAALYGGRGGAGGEDGWRGGDALHAVCERLRAAANDDWDSNPDPEKGYTLILLCTVAFQERAAAALEYEIDDDWEQDILAAIKQADLWTQYRVALAALRYAHHGLAGRVLSVLYRAAPHEAAQRWLLALYRAAAADHHLKMEGISGLEQRAASWELAGDAGGAGGAACCAGCGGCALCAGMCGAWLRLGARATAALARATSAARALCTQPPPATAHVNTQSCRVVSRRAGACCAALSSAAQTAAAVAAAAADIARSAFHADEHTLRHLLIQQHTYNMFAQFLERITTSNYMEKQTIEVNYSVKELKPTNLEERIMLSVCDKLEEISDKLFNNPTTKPGITHRHARAVLSAVEALCVGGGGPWPLGACCGGAMSARCRLALDPAPRPPPADHAAALPLSHHLALKVEGVVLPPGARRKKKKEREVKGVQLTVTATPHPRTNEKTVELTNVPPVLTAVQTVTPVRDFFSAQQLISVPSAGLYTVAVEAAFVDQAGTLWNTGPKSQVVIKAHEDPASKGNTQAARGRF